MKTVADLHVGDSAIVDHIEGESSTNARLMTFGVLPGTALKLVQVAPLGDPLTIEVQGQRISVRKAEASSIHLK